MIKKYILLSLYYTFNFNYSQSKKQQLPLLSSPSCSSSAILKKFFICSSFMTFPKFSRNFGGFCEMGITQGLSLSQADFPPGYLCIITWDKPWNLAIQSSTRVTNSRVRPVRQLSNFSAGKIKQAKLNRRYTVLKLFPL